MTTLMNFFDPLQMLTTMLTILNLTQMKTKLCKANILDQVISTNNNFQNCSMEFFSTESWLRKTFRQLNNRYVVKQQYNPLNSLYFCPSQPRFHSYQKLNMALHWLRFTVIVLGVNKPLNLKKLV